MIYCVDNEEIYPPPTENSVAASTSIDSHATSLCDIATTVYGHNEHFYWLDLIRFIAALLVMASHFRVVFFVDYGLLPNSQHSILTAGFYTLTRMGHEAVLIFFVLSGFLVGGKAISRIHDNTFQCRNYVIDRAVRILLPLSASLLFALGINIVIGNDVDLPILLGNLCSLQGIFCKPYFDTLWSLSYEVWFYILIFGIGYCIMNKEKVQSYIGWIIILICLAVFTKLWTVHLFIWIIGAFAFILFRIKNRITLWSSVIFSIITLIVLQLGTDSNAGMTLLALGNHTVNVLTLLHAFFVSLFITQVVQFAPTYALTQKINKLGTKLAAFSYTLYLVHMPMLDLLSYLGVEKSESINFSNFGMYIFCLLLTLLIAYGIYYIFERNTPIVKRWVKSIAI